MNDTPVAQSSTPENPDGVKPAQLRHWMHEMRNHLYSISLNAKVIEAYSKEPDIKQNASEIEAVIEKCSEICNKITHEAKSVQETEE